MSKSLLLSLGHNSSALLVAEGHPVCGFEEERISRRKSDSRFPSQAIMQIHRVTGVSISEISDIYVSHWYPDCKLPKDGDKYWDPGFIADNYPEAKLHTLSIDFTHHDAHAWSAMAFASEMDVGVSSTALIVADGFGNFGEVVSIYTVLAPHGFPTSVVLKQRAFGYTKSLGLLYQYATSYLGLKENQDEYKLLGYEVHIDNVTEPMVAKLNELIGQQVKFMLRMIKNGEIISDTDPMISVDALPRVRLSYVRHFDTVLSELGLATDENTAPLTRTIIAYYAQSVIEDVLSIIVDELNVTNLILAGGLFYNVKLNKVLSERVRQICIMPLAGDQGAPIGLYHAMKQDFKFPNHLFWGRRTLIPDKRIRRLIYTNSLADTADKVSYLLKKDNIVNVVHGAMEFGPRALCNTSTLAQPTKYNSEYINMVNMRANVMPMAPVMWQQVAKIALKNYDKVHKSLAFMIIALECNIEDSNDLLGVTHTVAFKPGTETARAQVWQDHPFLQALALRGHQILINTSFNIHKEPIVYDMADVIHTHCYQSGNDVSDRIYTVVQIT